MSELAQSLSQVTRSRLLRASLVKATALPSPYCQSARIGNCWSPCGGPRIGVNTSGEGLAVVRTKPYRGDNGLGSASVGPPFCSKVGTKRFSKTNDWLTSRVSLV